MPINRPFIRLQLLSSIKDSTHSLGHCTGKKIHPQNLSFLHLVPLCCNSQLKSSQVWGKESEFFSKDTAPKAAPEHGRDLTWNGTGNLCPRSHAGNETTKKFSGVLWASQAMSWHSWEPGHALQDSQELIFLINYIWASKYPQKCYSHTASATSHQFQHVRKRTVTMLGFSRWGTPYSRGEQR